ncbi:ATP-dependent DNA helicase RuvA [Aequorivita aquimaris]|jgi:Holliday junction DNA helicase RuvA|uniref:Holliday junction branch migration complex subunit RuvA n=1 Tax=Aequorivita aquimaris TaxID=1548749 RepID=A0A137RJN4_9FLAO|nr:Holliday junction branch migration protein RuvA [Aequorivita aquimaris]KXO00390.1 ATP-dependent DNA helicase RuvA [Aequorivita aquimaris]MBG43628.1 Holliday junction branch migration protein RuvA [Aequorivita sp.]|tara:strand:+ start:68885 stop:69466 length:582 start_codon:yes stop_codon:yes gene_type:complete
MITHIQGRLVEKNPTDVVIDCNGVGYFINISLHTFSELPTSENVKLFTHLLIRDDAHTLYGFSGVAEREIFRLLISVSGVGASTARTMLSSLAPEQVLDAIAQNDIATIQSVKGIGAKTAQRVVLDLKDKILKVYGLSSISTGTSNTNKNEALSALETLGFVRKQSEKVVDAIVKENPQASVEMIIKQALKNL